MFKAAGALWVLACLFFFSCDANRHKPKTEESKFEKPFPTGKTAGLTGYQLAMGYCGSCHLFPDPSLLDKETWKKGVLPNMALRMGLDPDGANPYAGMHFEDIPVVAQAGVFASKPLISKADWAKIVNYYDSAAPAQLLPREPRLGVEKNIALFTSKPLHFKNRKIPLTTLAKFDEANNRFYVADKESNLFILDKNFSLLDSIKLESPASDVQVNPDGSFNLLTLGVLEPSDRYKGGLARYTTQVPGTSTSQNLVPLLNRPVEATYADLDQNGLTDIVICNYGNHTGKLVWFRNKGNGQYEEKILKNSPGSRNVKIMDFNRDGRPDIMVLVAQASESVSLFLNLGEGAFREKQLLQFPPVYGSSYLEVADFNQDGWSDILLSNGDNADYSMVLKDYHGLRLFLNDGRNNFKQAWFYPMHGAAKAIAHDFDEDGDIDIAAIAFFPDFKSEDYSSFVYLENKGNLNFSPSTFKEANSGRWLTLETADVDQDGDKDLILGSFISAPSVVPLEVQKNWYLSGPNIVVLINKHQVPVRAEKGIK